MPLLTFLNKQHISDSIRNKANDYFDGRLTSSIVEEVYVSYENMKKKKRIDLSHKKLKDNESLFDLNLIENCIFLNLSNNRLSNMSTIGRLPYLKELNMSNNKLQSLNDGKKFDELPKLEILDISFNCLNDINGISFLKSLKKLLASNNNITKIESISKLSLLKKIDLSKNKIRKIEFDSSSELPLLNSLILDYNYLKNIDFLVKFSYSLTYFSCQFNKIQCFSSINSLKNMKEISEVMFSGNPIIKQPGYRLHILEKNLNIIKIDNIEITKEEKDYVTSEISSFENNQIQEEIIYLPIKEKSNTKVNMISLGMDMPLLLSNKSNSHNIINVSNVNRGSSKILLPSNKFNKISEIYISPKEEKTGVKMKISNLSLPMIKNKKEK